MWGTEYSLLVKPLHCFDTSRRDTAQYDRNLTHGIVHPYAPIKCCDEVESRTAIALRLISAIYSYYS